MTNLADLIYAGDNPNVPNTARVEAVNADGTVDLSYLGGVARRVPVVSAYASPASGDIVQIMRLAPGSFLALGPVKTSNVTSAPIRADLVLSYNVEPVPSAAPVGSPGGSGVFDYWPIETRSYRSGTGWTQDSDFVAQGAYETRWGYYHGCAFYGDGAFANLRGRAITRVLIDLRRKTGSGVFAAEPVYLYLLQNATRPSGAPFFGQYVGPLYYSAGQTGRVDLPLWVGDRLRDGQAFGLGIAHYSTADYLRMAGKSEYGDSFRLNISWRE